jgi:glycosyltransferase involved in cell wall biosynthesis
MKWLRVVVRKIVHIITRMDRGGSAQNTLCTCLALSRRYEQVLIHGLSLESQMTGLESRSVDSSIQEAEKRGVKIIRLPSLVRRIDPPRDLIALFSLWWLLIRERPAIVHTHTSKAGILGRCAAMLAGVHAIVHTPHGHVFYGHFGSPASRVFLLVERLMALITDRLIALTKGEKDDYIGLSVGDPKKIVTIHSGIDVDRYMKVQVNVEEKRRALGLDPKALIVGTVGWLLPIKGPIYLLKAMEEVWKDHPETSLVYVGKGDLEEELKREASVMGVSQRVWFLGWRDDIPEIMHILDIFVLPSLNEGMGRVLVEAMAAGRPVVASNTGGIPDLVVQGENGLLVPAADALALARGIEFLIAHPEKRRELGEQGRKMSIRFGSNFMVQKIDQLYLELLREHLPSEMR